MRICVWSGTLLCLVTTVFAEEPKYKIWNVPDSRDEFKIDDEESRPAEVVEAKIQSELPKQIADAYVLKGQRALKEGRLEQAEMYFDQALKAVPNHPGAKEGMKTLMMSWEPKPVATQTPQAASKPNEESDQKRKERLKASKEKSKKLYVDALTASQGGKVDLAISLCQEALEWDPSNQQAKRMLSRLIPGPNLPTRK